MLAFLAAAIPTTAAEHIFLAAGREAVIEMRTAALIMSGQQGGILPIAVGVLPRSVDDDVAMITAMVEIDGAALLESHPEASSLVIEVFAYVLGRELEVVDQESLSVDLDPALHAGLLASTGLKVFLPLEMPRDDRLLRVLARAGEAFGLRSLELSAGAPGAETPVLWPVFHELDQPWLLVAGIGVEGLLPPPFGFAGGAPLPTTRPLLADGETLSAQVFATGTQDKPWRLEALLRGPNGEVSSAPLDIVGRAVPGPGLETLAVELPAPELEGGLHEIAVALTPEETGIPPRETGAGTEVVAQSSFVPLFVDTAPAPPATPVAAAPATDAPKEPLSRAQKQLVRATAAGYTSALRQLAAGQWRAAVAALQADEARVVEALDADAVPVLKQSESRVLAALDDADWGCVLPIILLHIDLSREYRKSHRFILAHHATTMAVDLANSYARKLATPEAEHEAAGALSSLAGYFQEGGALSQAERFFSLALAVTGDDAASLGLASILEKRGLFDQAVPALEDFVASRPEHPEGRLRLALNHYRTGRIEAARAALGDLVAERTTTGNTAEWATLLAHQELARLEMDQDHLPEAAAVLRQGLERWPGHSTLTIQLAYVLDAEGDLLSSRQLLADLDLADEDHTASKRSAGERSRYNRWPDEIQRASRAALAETARQRLADLGRWLDGLLEADGG